MDKRIKVGVVGCGYWGPNLIRNFFENSNVELQYVCDLSQDRLAKISKRYPTVTVLTKYEHLLQDDRLDAIVIATPVDSHYDLAKKALTAGKHVLVEKPMCVSSLECRELIALAERKRLTLMVDHTFVYHGAVRRIKAEIEKGELGEILYFDSVRINLGLFQNDVNVVMDLAVHDISIMDYLLGKTPTSVLATGSSHARDGLEDIAYITMKFPDQLIGHMHVSWLSPVKIRQILIGGTKKMIVFDDLQITEKVRIYDKGISLAEPMPDESRYQNLIKYRIGDMYAPVIELDEAIKLEVSDFVNSIISGKAPESDGHAGLRVVSMLEAANLALRSERAQPLSLNTSQAVTVSV